MKTEHLQLKLRSTMILKYFKTRSGEETPKTLRAEKVLIECKDGRHGWPCSFFVQKYVIHRPRKLPDVIKR